MKLSSLPRLAAIGVVALGLGACTQASESFDRVAGTNTSDRFPSQADGTRANPPGTAAERVIDRTLGTNLSDPADARAAQRRSGR